MSNIEINARYRHFKGGMYTVRAIAFDTATESEVVVYVSQDNNWYTRPVTDFLAVLDRELYPDAKQPVRFVKAQ